MVCCGVVEIFYVEVDMSVVGEVDGFYSVVCGICGMCLDVVVIDVWFLDGNGVEFCC